MKKKFNSKSTFQFSIVQKKTDPPYASTIFIPISTLYMPIKLKHLNFILKMYDVYRTYLLGSLSLNILLTWLRKIVVLKFHNLLTYWFYWLQIILLWNPINNFKSTICTKWMHNIEKWQICTDETSVKFFAFRELLGVNSRNLWTAYIWRNYSSNDSLFCTVNNPHKPLPFLYFLVRYGFQTKFCRGNRENRFYL